jgi:hypothetical protein
MHPAFISPMMDRELRRLLGRPLTKEPALSALRRLLREDRAAANRELFEETIATEARRVHGRTMKWVIDAEIVTIPGELLDEWRHGG